MPDDLNEFRERLARLEATTEGTQAVSRAIYRTLRNHDQWERQQALRTDQRLDELEKHATRHESNWRWVKRIAGWSSAAAGVALGWFGLK